MEELDGDVSGCTNYNMGVKAGGEGGNGSVTVTNVQSELNYIQKEIELLPGQNYDIDETKIQLVSQNKSQNNTTIANISYQILDTEIATVTNSGKITAIKEGHTKLKITDNANELETYIYIKVINEPEARLSIGKNFTIALKTNGTVWSFGRNNAGQCRNRR